MNNAILACASIAIFCLLMTMWIPVYLCEHDCWQFIVLAAIPLAGITSIGFVWMCCYLYDPVTCCTETDTETV